MSDKKMKTDVLSKIIVGVVLALFVGGSAPWWWQEIVKDPERPEDSKGSKSTNDFELTLIGSPKFAFLGSGGGVGPPRWYAGRYAFLSDVRVSNPGKSQLVVRSVRVSLTEQSEPFAEGKQTLGSLDQWKISAGKTEFLQLQIRTEILRNKETFKSRFELIPGQAKPRFELNLKGTIVFEILTPDGELVMRSFTIDPFEVLIQPFG